MIMPVLMHAPIVSLSQEQGCTFSHAPTNSDAPKLMLMFMQAPIVDLDSLGQELATASGWASEQTSILQVGAPS